MRILLMLLGVAMAQVSLIIAFHTSHIIISITAKIMLDKMRKFTISQKRLRLSCTGYASQSLSNENIDVGTVYIGVGFGTKTKIIKKKFKNEGRVSIINSTVKALIYESIQILSQ